MYALQSCVLMSVMITVAVLMASIIVTYSGFVVGALSVSIVLFLAVLLMLTTDDTTWEDFMELRLYA